MIKFVVTICQILRLKCAKFKFLTALSQTTQLDLRGLTSKGWEERGAEGKGGKGRGEKGKGWTTPQILNWL